MPNKAVTYSMALFAGFTVELQLGPSTAGRDVRVILVLQAVGVAIVPVLRAPISHSSLDIIGWGGVVQRPLAPAALV